MNKNEKIALSEDVFFPLFPPQSVIPVRGEGCYIYDSDDKKYLDFAAGIAVTALGHAHPDYIKVAKEQMEKLMLVPATFITEEKLYSAQLLADNTCFDNVFFTNSGTEAMEGALKLARKWAYETKGPDCNEIVAFHNAFHGRTYGAASITNKSQSQPFFAPYLSGIQFAHFNDINSVKDAISDKTAAIVIEPVQGEGGVTPADKDFMVALRALCDEQNIALIFDEIQAGMGRTGTFLAHEQFGIEPDIATLAKGLGAGFPVGALVAKKKFGAHFTPGSHGSTYGGNALATKLAGFVMETILADGFMEHVSTMGQRLTAGLEDIKRRTNKIEDVRGMGLMIGVDTTWDIATLRNALMEAGLLTTQAGANTLRLTPPLIVSADEIDEALHIIETVLRSQDA